MTKGTHEYASRLVWEDSSGEGTAAYERYSRQYRVSVAGKADFIGSADAAFRGEAGKYNPEDLFLISLSACHLLSYLALCAWKGIRVLAYEDEARGTLKLSADGGGKFEEITLSPSVTIADSAQVDLALQLHDTAHAQCYIAQSCSVPVRHKPTVRAQPG